MRPPMTAKLLESHEIAPEVRHFVFQVEDADSFSYVPGQFVSCTAEIDGSPITRAYSMAAPSCGARLDLCLNRVAEGHLSPYLFGLQPGDSVQMTGLEKTIRNVSSGSKMLSATMGMSMKLLVCPAGIVNVPLTGV